MTNKRPVGRPPGSTKEKTKVMRSYRLHTETIALLEAVALFHGLSMADAIEIAIHDAYGNDPAAFPTNT